MYMVAGLFGRLSSCWGNTSETLMLLTDHFVLVNSSTKYICIKPRILIVLGIQSTNLL